MSIGDPVPRPDGPAKVTGGAKYAADQSVPGILHAVYVGAPIPAGRVASIDIASALASIFTPPKGLTPGGTGQGSSKRSRRPFHQGTGVRWSSRPEAMRIGL
jgi:hypothetical protein